MGGDSFSAADIVIFPGLQVLLRALAKWLLLPGWILAAMDTQERTLHDLLCGTLVLQGRRRK